MKVEDVMTRPARSCRSDASMAAAAEIMLDARCGFLPVVEESGAVIGVVTDRDICLAVAKIDRPASMIPVSQIIRRPVIGCRANDEIHKALHAMEGAHIRRLPVLDDEGRVVGVVSMTDVVARTGRPAGRGARRVTESEAVETLRAIQAAPRAPRAAVLAAE
jgi:CBS domain-containing protein